MKAVKETKSRATNDHMTKQCRHGDQDMCDYCLIAFGNHADEPGVKEHRMEPNERYTCAQCAKAGADTLASRQEARAEKVAEHIAAKMFEGRKGHGNSAGIVERHLRRREVKEIAKLAYEQGVKDGLRDGRAG